MLALPSLAVDVLFPLFSNRRRAQSSFVFMREGPANPPLFPQVAIKIIPRFTSTASAQRALAQSQSQPADSSSGAGPSSSDPQAKPSASFLAKAAAKDASKEVRTMREGSLCLLLHHPYVCGMKEMLIYPVRCLFPSLPHSSPFRITKQVAHSILDRRSITTTSSRSTSTAVRCSITSSRTDGCENARRGSLRGRSGRRSSTAMRTQLFTAVRLPPLSFSPLPLPH